MLCSFYLEKITKNGNNSISKEAEDEANLLEFWGENRLKNQIWMNYTLSKF
jgi:hypothetical protein